jgi:glutathione S-transferase
MAKPKLISFKLCPYVQRAVITLKEKNVDFEIEYIDLAQKPDWFLKISPLGKVPLLIVEEEVIFESAVINEYLEEAYAPKLHPTSLIAKAKNRAWIEFSSGILVDLYMLATVSSESEYIKFKKNILDKLSRIESILPNPINNEILFNGSNFSLVDSSIAPLLQRISFLESNSNEVYIPSEKVRIWTNTLLKRESIQNSILPEVPIEYINYSVKHNSYFSKNFLIK